MVEVVILGSGGSIPTANRNHPAILLKYEGWNLLFDAGEDVQRRIEPFGINRKMAIFVSHLHSDHLLGLPGILLRFSLLGRIKPLQVYGPVGLINWVKMAQSTINLGTTFETTVYGIEKGGTIFSDDCASIRTFEVDHRGFSLGYEFKHQRPTGTFLPEKAVELGVPKGSLWGKLASGDSVRLPNGTLVTPEQVTLPPNKGIKIVYSGDTRPCDAIREASEKADILIHEAMYTSDHTALAAERGHSTASQAAEIAAECDVGLLVLTHYSPRYEDDEVLLEEAQGIFEKSVLAKDLMRISLSLDGTVSVENPET
ncbi:MAG: ribonuclease Z [Candidatus Thorarchaeota archaeon]